MSDPPDARLAAVRRAAEAARSIGLSADAEAADAVVQRVGERAGFSGDAYVMALAGGTGVGKSSLLNALAGQAISTVRAVRPTTDEPLAWVAEARREEVEPLLAWLGVRHVVGHADSELASVVILDLPDVDSVRIEHRQRVDELLPRIDAVTWVADPEKYDDERIHAYLRQLAGHADRMRFVINKGDRLTDAQRPLLADDLRARLAADGIANPEIHVVSATAGDGLDELRAALARAADAKAVLAAKRAADLRASLTALAVAAGIGADGASSPLLSADRLASATDDAVAGALALVDPDGLARQVRARRDGASPPQSAARSSAERSRSWPGSPASSADPPIRSPICATGGGGHAGTGAEPGPRRGRRGGGRTACAVSRAGAGGGRCRRRRGVRQQGPRPRHGGVGG